MLSPLTLEEKVQVGRIFGHDFKTELIYLLNIATRGHDGSRKEEAENLALHLDYVIDAFDMLSSTKERFLHPTSDYELKSVTQTLSKVLQSARKSASSNVAHVVSFDSSTPLLYASLFNLVKNSFEAKPGCSVTVEIGPFSGVVQDIVYLPEGAKSEGSFVRIGVHDTGSGFPRDKPLAENLEPDSSSKVGGGFGLFFVKMVAKYLQAPLAIHSEPGNTSVALYHPLGLPE